MKRKVEINNEILTLTTNFISHEGKNFLNNYKNKWEALNRGEKVDAVPLQIFETETVEANNYSSDDRNYNQNSSDDDNNSDSDEETD